MAKFFRFFLSGAITYSLSLGGTYFLIQDAGWTYLYAYSLMLIILALINFMMALVFVFRKHYQQSMVYRYIAALIGFSCLNYLTSSTLVFLLGESSLYWIIFFVTGFLFILKFFIYKKFVFTQTN